MNILRYYNQNKRSLWIIAGVIVGAFVVLRVANYMAELSLEEKEKKATEVIHTADEYKENPDINVQIDNEQVEDQKILIIDQFIRYCNAGKVDYAYNLLSTSCKNNLYPTLDKFVSKYYSKIYDTTKLYKKEFYASGTYKIKLMEDSLATGKLNQEYLEDYFTIVNENDETKLNISRLIRETEPNIVTNGKYLDVIVKKILTYKDTVVMDFEIKNLTNKTIMLDSLSDPKTTYLTSKDNIKYYAALNETPSYDLVLYSNLSSIVRIRFKIDYNGENRYDRIVFSNIILDKNKYDSIEKKKDFNEIGSMTILLNK